MKRALIATLLLTGCGADPGAALTANIAPAATPEESPEPAPSPTPTLTCAPDSVLTISSSDAQEPFCFKLQVQRALSYVHANAACGPGRMCDVPELVAAHREGLTGAEFVWTYKSNFNPADRSPQYTGYFDTANGTYSLVNIQQTNFYLKSHCCYPPTEVYE